LQLLSICV